MKAAKYQSAAIPTTFGTTSHPWKTTPHWAKSFVLMVLVTLGSGRGSQVRRNPPMSLHSWAAHAIPLQPPLLGDWRACRHRGAPIGWARFIIRRAGLESGRTRIGMCAVDRPASGIVVCDVQ